MPEDKPNPWIELLIEVEEMRIHQKGYFKDRSKINLAKSKLSEIKVDQLVRGLKESCETKGIKLY